MAGLITPTAMIIAALSYYSTLTTNVDNIDVGELKCMADNIYFEARNQIGIGQRAVAHVTLNRLMSSKFPGTVCGVVKQGRKYKNGHPIKHRCQFSWFCDGKSDKIHLTYTRGKFKGQIRPEVYLSYSYAVSEAIASMIGWTEDPTNGATYYYAHNKVTPRWSKRFRKVAKIQDHTFMKPDSEERVYPKPPQKPYRKK